MKTHQLPVIPWGWAWGALALAYPWSNAFMSVATGFLGLAAILRAIRLAGAPRSGEAQRGLMWGGAALILLVAWSGFSCLWGGGFETCLNDVRVKLPLVAGGLAMVVMAREAQVPDGRVADTVLRLAVFSAALATVAVVVLDLMDGGSTGGRQASRFISHIRFGLWWALLLPWVLHRLGPTWKGVGITGAVLAWTWTQGLTGILAGVVLLPWWWSGMGVFPPQRSRVQSWPAPAEVRRRGARLAMFGLPLVAVGIWALPTALPDGESLPERSAAGEAYIHKMDRSVTENGHHVWTEIAWGELTTTWQQRSEVPVDSIQGALVRFLASKGAPKDREGVLGLSSAEVAAIASGVPSVVELTGNGWNKRWNRFKYNWGDWWDGRKTPDASILSRTVYFQAGVAAVKKAPIQTWLMGVGTGAFEVQLANAYDREFPDWPLNSRKRPHNQYLTLFLSLGLVGVLLFLVALGSMWSCHPARPALLLLALSCFTEDTLETQAGVTLAIVAFAWGAFIPHRPAA